MPKAKARVISVLPGAAHLKPLLLEFAKGGGGTITSLHDSKLRSLNPILPEGAPAEIRPFGAVVGGYITLGQGRSLPLAQSGHVSAAVSEACLSLPEDSVLFNAA